MTATVAIATAEQDMFETLHRLLLGAGLTAEEIHGEPLRTIDQTSDWIAASENGLLVLDAEIPLDPRSRRDSRNDGARSICQVVQAREPPTPVLLIVPSFAVGLVLEAECMAIGRALMLPMDTLLLHQHRILRPFIAMLAGVRDEETNAVAGGIRVIETVVKSNKVECRLGTGGDNSMLLWNTVTELQDLKAAVREYTRDDAPQGRDARRWVGSSLPNNWLDQSRTVGIRLFKSFVVKAVGEHLFSEIESAAGGLEGLSFRFVIDDADAYPAPFEASVRYLQSEENGPFVLLYAPIVRRVPPRVRLKAPRSGRIERGARLLFVRSQMGEHPEQPLGAMTYRNRVFDKLGNIDAELGFLQALGVAGHFELTVIDLSKAPPGEAASCLTARIDEVRPTILHYAGHAWSENQDSATLVLPGLTPEDAMGLGLDRLTSYEGLSATKLVYLSACRGISKGSVEQLVMNDIPYALGFRWNVEDERAPHFAEAFYNELCQTQSVSLAFRKACRASWARLKYDEESPIWISPILLAQSNDWATRSYRPIEIGAFK